MKYFYRKTNKVEALLRELDVLKELIERLPRLPHIEENLRRQSLLGSAVYSARIEGNPLKLKDVGARVEKTESRNKARIEIGNILRALHWLRSEEAPKRLFGNLVLRLHRLVLANLSPCVGHFRNEPGAIFDSAGNVVYFAPSPQSIVGQIDDLIENIRKSKDASPIKAAVFHFGFEKIHPFLDGNGRVGRLLSAFILDRGGFGFRGLVSLEEYLEKNRDAYYTLLGSEGRDITRFVEFLLEGLKSQAEAAVAKLQDQKESSLDWLLPRRREIYEIIRDHDLVSFDFLHRRFLSVPRSSLHFDLASLQKMGFIRKLGTTRGVQYAAISR